MDVVRAHVRVVLKKEYNDAHSTPNSTQNAVPLMNGNQWYGLQAFRALNQALGRGIRHVNDWCAMLLLDTRHKDGSTTNKLSKWLRPRVVDYDDQYGELMHDLEKFFEKHKQ